MGNQIRTFEQNLESCLIKFNCCSFLMLSNLCKALPCKDHSELDIVEQSPTIF